MNPSATPEISKYDQAFFNDVTAGDTLEQDISFFLNPLLRSKLLSALNVFICDTVVVSKGVVAYYMFNSDAGKGPLRVITKPNQLIFPVLTTYFVKRRALLYNRVAKKEPDFTNISHFFDKPTIKTDAPRSPYTGAVISPFEPEPLQSVTLVTEVGTEPIPEEDAMLEVAERDSEQFEDEQTHLIGKESSAVQRNRVASSGTLTAELTESPRLGREGERPEGRMSISIKEIRLRPQSASKIG